MNCCIPTIANDWRGMWKSSCLARPPRANYRIIRPSDGQVRWIRDTGFPIRDERGEIKRVAGVAQDVTAEKERSEELAESEERFRLLVEGARDYAIFLIDPGNQIIYWSAGAERIFGWSAEEALGESGVLIFTPEDRAIGREQKGDRNRDARGLRRRSPLAHTQRRPPHLGRWRHAPAR